VTSYREAGVDQDAADGLIPAFAELAAKTGAQGGGFAGLLTLDEVLARGYARPALAASTDTVGTKIELLRGAGHHRTAGWDCVAMNVDDVVCTGAEPLLFVDCIATERLDPREATEIVTGVAEGCVESGCKLVGGETAQLPGLLTPGAYEVMGTCVGVVDLDRAWGPQRVRAGDAIVGLAASGLHSNGYSLVRRVLAGDEPPDFLLTPTVIYARKVLALAEDVEVHAAAHVTGGGIPGNVGRALPAGAEPDIDFRAWPRPEVYDWLSDRGVSELEMLATFNLGIGMLVITPDADDAIRALAAVGVESWAIGAVV
jgi:phosphoribosylformylglycinamidine cyclo-ligase